jgi:predicted metal-dependent phosphoesterase TrpH
LAITDHNTLDSAFAAQQLAPRYGVDVVVGEEISTREGHLLALFLKERIPPALSMSETIAAVHAQGAVAVVAHPYDVVSFGALNPWRRKLSEGELLQLPFDGVEVLNGCLLGSSQNARAAALGLRSGRALVGGSDAHSAETVGIAHTIFAGCSSEDLRTALMRGETVPGGQRWQFSHYVHLLGQRELQRVVSVGRLAAGLGSLAASPLVGVLLRLGAGKLL